MADNDITPAPEYDEAAPAAATPGAAAATPGEARKSGKAIAALILGILSLIAPFGIVFGLIAIVLGVIGRKEIAADSGLEGAGMALAGIITGAIGSAIFVVFVAVAAASGG
jgi:uncharacterized protein DUF4190